MYNRYIPQADGSFRRSRVPENSPEPRRNAQNTVQAAPPSPPPPPPSEPEPTAESASVPQPNTAQSTNRPPRRDPRPEPQGSNVMGFLKQLLPQDFDTGDLIVVLLLLLMSENSRGGQNTALLTLVIYLFL